MEKERNKLVSIIITSYNYGHFLNQTIDSALSQTYSAIEVIVVDDGSEDNSRELITDYGDSVKAIFKENSGQASAFNAGFKISKGSAICFMDSDDLLLPTAIEESMTLLVEGTVKVHWPLKIINEYGKETGGIMHLDDISEGDLRNTVINNGPAGYNWPSTSGNIWSRQFIESVFPIPEVEYRIGPDVYLAALSPFFGLIKKVQTPQGCYRIHTNNNTFRKPIELRVKEALVHWDHSFKVLSDYCHSQGVSTNVDSWKASSWWHQMALSLQEIECAIPEKHTFVLVDGNQWVAGKNFLNRFCKPFLEKNEQYWGPPSDDDTAIYELENHRKSGVTFIVFASPAFWWLDEYIGLHNYLVKNFKCAVKNGRLIIFDLRRLDTIIKAETHEYCR